MGKTHAIKKRDGNHIVQKIVKVFLQHCRYRL